VTEALSPLTSGEEGGRMDAVHVIGSGTIGEPLRDYTCSKKPIETPTENSQNKRRNER
jgi:hypothetical protein